MSERSVVVDRGLHQHQLDRRLEVAGIEFKIDPWGWDDDHETWFQARFTFDATDEQWDRIQAWVKKVTG